MFLGLTIRLISPWPAPSTWQDKLAFSSFYVGGAICLGFSSAFHTCIPHSQRVSLALNRLDYTGISALIVGSFVPAIRFGFVCSPKTAAFFTALVVSLGAAATYTVLAPNGHSNENRRRRTWTFIGLGLSGVLPVAYACVSFGVSRLRGTRSPSCKRLTPLTDQSIF